MYQLQQQHLEWESNNIQQQRRHAWLDGAKRSESCLCGAKRSERKYKVKKRVPKVRWLERWYTDHEHWVNDATNAFSVAQCSGESILRSYSYSKGSQHTKSNPSKRCYGPHLSLPDKKIDHQTLLLPAAAFIKCRCWRSHIRTVRAVIDRPSPCFLTRTNFFSCFLFSSRLHPFIHPFIL